MEQTTDPAFEKAGLKRCDWDTFISEHEPKDFGDLSTENLEEGLMHDKVNLLMDTERFYESIYIRAIRASNKYYKIFMENLKTEFKTDLRPLVRWKRGRAVELIWVRKVIVETPATAKQVIRYSKNRTSENGIIYRIAYRNNQPVLIKEIYKYISRGRTDFYPLRIFNQEPAWVQNEGRLLEACFTDLRREMNLLREVKLKIQSLHVLQNHYFQSVFEKTSGNRVKYEDPRFYLKDDADASDED